LKQNYIVNPVLTNKQLGQAETKIIDVKYQRDGYTLKMGSFKEFGVRLSIRKIFNVYQKVSNGKYFIYTNNEIVLFPDKKTCLKYIEGQIK
jgi:hypothetical protein